MTPDPLDDLRDAIASTLERAGDSEPGSPAWWPPDVARVSDYEAPYYADAVVALLRERFEVRSRWGTWLPKIEDFASTLHRTRESAEAQISRFGELPGYRGAQVRTRLVLTERTWREAQ